MQEVEQIARVPANNVQPTCVACGATLGALVHFSHGAVSLHRCSQCASWTNLPRPTASGQIGLHDTAQYFDHPYFELRRNAARLIDRRCREVVRRLADAAALDDLRGLRLLDVGCDTGAFLESSARQFGVVPVGIDVAARAVARACDKGITAFRTDIEHAPAELGEFQIITALDVIEHVVDPLALLEAVHKRLAPNGIAYLETPNISSAVYGMGRALRSLADGRLAGMLERLFPPQHIQYFTRQGLTTLAQRSGLDVVQILQRVLPNSDIASSLLVRFGVASIQLVDRLSGEMILICAVLRRASL